MSGPARAPDPAERVTSPAVRGTTAPEPTARVGRAGGAARRACVNLANALTVVRLLLVPVFVACLLAGGGTRLADGGVRRRSRVASVTDLLDGRIARSRGLITDFGKIADPIADKALTGAALMTLSCLGGLSWWVTVVILVREVGITGLRFWVIRHGVIAASRGGKLKTLLQVLAISLYMLPRAARCGCARWSWPPRWLVTLVTGGDYVVRAVRLRRRPLSGPGPSGAMTPGRPVPRQAMMVGASTGRPGGPDRGRAHAAGPDGRGRRVAHRRPARARPSPPSPAPRRCSAAASSPTPPN